jgi:DNA recombination-dependent growth factor C
VKAEKVLRHNTLKRLILLAELEEKRLSLRVVKHELKDTIDTEKLQKQIHKRTSYRQFEV